MTRIDPRICLKVPLCPNLSQKVQKDVSQMANHNLSCMILLGGLSVNLNHLKSGTRLSTAHSTPLHVLDWGNKLAHDLA